MRSDEAPVKPSCAIPVMPHYAPIMPHWCRSSRALTPSGGLPATRMLPDSLHKYPDLAFIVVADGTFTWEYCMENPSFTVRFPPFEMVYLMALWGVSTVLKLPFPNRQVKSQNLYLNMVHIYNIYIRFAKVQC